MLDVERDGPILRVTLARPERRNAFDAALIARLHETFADVGDARAVVLTAQGPSFCAGADVEWQRASIELSLEENVADALRLHDMLAAVNGCAAPVVAGVHGHALGGGSGLAACADTVVAAPDAVFGFTEVRLGIAPAVISPFVLAKLGSRARRYFLTAERFDAETALRIGLVDEVDGDLHGALARIVEHVLQAGPEAVRAAKRLTLQRPQAGGQLARLAAGLRSGAEGQEGLRAFLEKREPSWRV
jgi:methylglutaconyl-CoA hydratase